MSGSIIKNTIFYVSTRFWSTYCLSRVNELHFRLDSMQMRSVPVPASRVSDELASNIIMQTCLLLFNVALAKTSGSFDGVGQKASYFLKLAER